MYTHYYLLKQHREVILEQNPLVGRSRIVYTRVKLWGCVMEIYHKWQLCIPQVHIIISYNRHHWLECFKYYCNLIGHIIIFIFWLAKLWDKVRNYSHFIHSAQAFLSKPNEVMAKHIVERDNRWGFLVKDAFNHFSNFIFKMVYCVESEVGPGFVVDVTRADGVTG